MKVTLERQEIITLIHSKGLSKEAYLKNKPFWKKYAVLEVDGKVKFVSFPEDIDELWNVYVTLRETIKAEHNLFSHKFEFLKRDFAKDVAKKRKKMGLSMDAASKEIGINKSTYHRIESDTPSIPDLMVFVSVCSWLKQDYSKYIRRIRA